jgi:hypothetical protein
VTFPKYLIPEGMDLQYATPKEGLQWLIPKGSVTLPPELADGFSPEWHVEQIRKTMAECRHGEGGIEVACKDREQAAAIRALLTEDERKLVHFTYYRRPVIRSKA